MLVGRAHAEVFTLPAEFETQDAVWMVARPYETERPTFGIVVQMIAALTPGVRINVLVADEKAREAVRGRLTAEGVDSSRVRYSEPSLPPAT